MGYNLRVGSPGPSGPVVIAVRGARQVPHQDLRDRQYRQLWQAGCEACD